MKTIILACILFISLSGCGVYQSSFAGAHRISNTFQNVTNVNLQSANFSVLKHVEGSATATYILGFGGLSKYTLIDLARKEMLKNAGLEGGSKAIANMITETHIAQIFPFYLRKTVTVSGMVVEFKQ